MTQYSDTSANSFRCWHVKGWRFFFDNYFAPVVLDFEAYLLENNNNIKTILHFVIAFTAPMSIVSSTVTGSTVATVGNSEPSSTASTEVTTTSVSDLPPAPSKPLVSFDELGGKQECTRISSLSVF